MEESHVLRGFRAVWERVTVEGPIDREVEAIAKSVQSAESHQEWDLCWIEHDKDQCDQALCAATQINKDLAAQPVGDHAASQTKWDGRHEHDQQPVRRELIGIIDPHDVVKERREEVGDDGDPCGGHESREDDPTEVAAPNRGYELPCRFQERPPRLAC